MIWSPQKAKAAAAPTTKTVAIYCRKSTEEGLDREFNSLDAQRLSCEQFAASQQHDGWRVSPERYDDGGFSGGNVERPALRRLLEEVQAGRVQVIAVYKLDRLSRSLTDFVSLLQVLEQHEVAFVSVTQQFNTATPMGRLMLHILICFAQFERENSIERIRDKVAATKRQGKWCGGNPVLGYDVPPGGRRLVVNEEEAERVRDIFALYLQKRGLMRVVRELTERGWTNKRWVTQDGVTKGGGPFTKSTLSRMLSQMLYVGRISYRGELIPAEHPAIVDLETFDEVQALLEHQHRSGGAETKTKHRPLLQGLLVCGPCQCGMTYCWTQRGVKHYGYYTCARSRNEGADSCPLPSLPTADMDALVVQEIAGLCRTPELADAIIGQAVAEQAAERSQLQDTLLHAEAVQVAATEAVERAGLRGLAERDRLREATSRLSSARAALAMAEVAVISVAEARQVLGSFDAVWSALAPREASEVLQSLVERIVIDGQTGKMSFVFRGDGIAALAQRAGAA